MTSVGATGPRKRPSRAASWVDRSIKWILVSPAIIVVVALTIFPLCFAIWTAFVQFDFSVSRQRASVGGARQLQGGSDDPIWRHSLWVTLVISRRWRWAWSSRSGSSRPRPCYVRSRPTGADGAVRDPALHQPRDRRRLLRPLPATAAADRRTGCCADCSADTVSIDFTDRRSLAVRLAARRGGRVAMDAVHVRDPARGAVRDPERRSTRRPRSTARSRGSRSSS